MMKKYRYVVEGRKCDYENTAKDVRSFVNGNFKRPDEIAIVPIEDNPDYDYKLFRVYATTYGQISTKLLGHLKIIEMV